MYAQLCLSTTVDNFVHISWYLKMRLRTEVSMVFGSRRSIGRSSKEEKFTVSHVGWS